MKIENTKELEALLKMLRKQGVVECCVDGMTFKLGELPEAKKPLEPEVSAQPQVTYTDEQLLFWSAGN